MGWNGSSSAGQPANGRTASTKPPQKNSPSLLRGVLAGVLICAALAGVIFYVMSGDKKSAPAPKDPKKPAAIKAVTPAPAPKTKESVARTSEERSHEKVEVDPRVENGIVVRPSWKPSKYGAFTTGVHRVKSDLEVAFPETPDRQIASLLSHEPGDGLVGDNDAMYYTSFEKDFLNSLKTPIIIEETDSDYVKELKRQVRETKLDLKIRYDNGEDIAKIMTESRRELRELGLYRQELRQMVEQFRQKEDVTADDLKDCVDAANKMLSERGAKPLAMPELVYRRLRLQAARRAKSQTVQ